MGSVTLDQNSPERPQSERCQLESLQAKRDRYDEEAHHHRHDEVGEGENQAAEDKPDEIQKEAHDSTMTINASLCSRREA
jgi:hypothetical protein